MASRQHILPSRLEIVGVPRVGYIAGLLGVVHQEMQLAGKIAATDTVHIPEVGSVHANQKIVLLVIGIGDLPCCVTVAGDPMFCQLATRWRINWVADLLPAGCRRFDMKL